MSLIVVWKVGMETENWKKSTEHELVKLES